ncbi:MAG: hypothetical protein JWP28_597 [Phenylobacterium sp.]|uniref:hypothetical protein n=1 Tax=Phenylobacterium sp. TaxID=1871053 RepID=UPI00262391AB|nr:hypothetical protein [Phenylobacterium sp.]MDB5496566.1 hypothetical protein [Phenylobacterium sp.]
MEPFDTYVREWPVISHAPLSAATIILASIAGGWGLAQLHFRGRLETLKERVQLRDDQLAALGDKLENAPNAEAALVAAKAELVKQSRLTDKGKRGGYDDQLAQRLIENSLDWDAPRPNRPRNER